MGGMEVITIGSKDVGGFCLAGMSVERRSAVVYNQMCLGYMAVGLCLLGSGLTGGPDYNNHELLL
jgi:hypothetical protein